MDRAEYSMRMGALRNRSLSQGTMNSAMGSLGAMLDVDCPCGWLPTVERMYDGIEDLLALEEMVLSPIKADVIGLLDRMFTVSPQPSWSVIGEEVRQMFVDLGPVRPETAWRVDNVRSSVASVFDSLSHEETALTDFEEVRKIRRKVREDLEQAFACHFSIEQIKEKFAGLRVYHSGWSPEVEAIVGHAIGECRHRCQICGERGRHVVIGGWHSVFCAAHTRARVDREMNADELPGLPWPKLPLMVDLVTVTGNGGFVEKGSPWHTLRMGGEEMGCGRFDAELMAEIARYLHSDDADVYALEPEETSARFDAVVFGDMQRPFRVRPAMPILLANATTLGIEAGVVEALVAEVPLERTKPRNVAWHRLCFILRGELGEEE